jgi:hypothetical protein
MPSLLQDACRQAGQQTIQHSQLPSPTPPYCFLGCLRVLKDQTCHLWKTKHCASDECGTTTGTLCRLPECWPVTWWVGLQPGQRPPCGSSHTFLGPLWEVRFTWRANASIFSVVPYSFYKGTDTHLLPTPPTKSMLPQLKALPGTTLTTQAWGGCQEASHLKGLHSKHA